MQPSKRPHHRASRWRGSQIGGRGSHPEGSRNSARPLLPLTVRGSGGLGFRHTVHLGRPSERTPSEPPGRYARRALRSRILFGVLLVLGLLSSATYATSGARVSPVRQWAIVNFDSTTAVSGALLNAGRLADCPSIRIAKPGGGLLLFRVYSITWCSTNDKLTEFRFEADSEGHGVPDRTLFLALNEVSG